MHSVNISALFLATTAVAAAGRTFFSVPFGLDKGAVSNAFSSRGIQGFDPSARPNADGLYTANNIDNEHHASEEHMDKVERMEPQHYRMDTIVEMPMMPYHPLQHEELEQQQPIMFHPAVAALDTFADAPPFPQSAPRVASIIAPQNIAAMSDPPPGRPVAIPLAQAHEPRPGLLVAPPVIVNPNAQIQPQALIPNPPTIPMQQPPPLMMPTQPTIAAAAIPTPQIPASAVSAAAVAETAIIQSNAILTSTVIVMATAPRPLAQSTAVGKSGDMGGSAEEDEFEDEASNVAAKPAAITSTPQQQQQVAQSQLSASIAATPTEPSARSISQGSASMPESKPTGPVKLKPLMFAKANMSVFKPEDLDKFTFPSAELSVNMAGLGRESSANIPHSAAATGFEGSMPNIVHAKPTSAINTKAGGIAAKSTSVAAPDIVGVASVSKPRHEQNPQASDLPSSSVAAAPRGDNESSAVSAMQQAYVGAAVLLALTIHIAVAMI
ncbi:hypothetical protein H4S07_001808 [Coemansia furcata]|uniref:Uncharacterized protein n=1 Tax=Coemansia furcata TaxID=417177 RepID=A0ACC1LLD3_9FUNG|nr:hypothetical protein H4S07_001808 [Coemansia furcata]